MIGAEQAAQIGLVNRVVALAELLGQAGATASQIARGGPLAISAAKRVLLRGQDASLIEACELEAQAFASLFGSEDQGTGMRAFLAKEKARFKGR